MLEITESVYLNENEEIIKEINNVDDIQTQMTSLEINSLTRSKFM